MLDALSGRRLRSAVPITLVNAGKLDAWTARQPEWVGEWLTTNGFAASPGTYCLVPDTTGALARVVVGIDHPAGLWDLSALPAQLPAGHYALDVRLSSDRLELVVLGWALGAYRFARYKRTTEEDESRAVLEWPVKCDRKAVERAALATGLVRDLATTPASDLGPAELAAAAKTVAKKFKAECTVIVGDNLLKQNYPLIHAVGRASERAPRLIDLRWGSSRAPKLSIVGKGVCFDTGGLDLKPSSNMLLMKKDMCGGAHALALAQMIMSARLKVQLRVLIPAVENSVSSDAYRPSDVLMSRAGLTVEVGNTDAEGRLVMADALAELDDGDPDLLIDFSTLTGAQRVACGYDLPSYFTNDERISAALMKASDRVADPMWRLPLFEPYRSQLDSPIADINSTGKVPMGGAILAALFLRAFIDRDRLWIHTDFMGWNTASRPGRPLGGEAQGLRAMFAMLAVRYGK
ncbi:MAG TPA: leucyl aminopeptidase family protein [Sneathiellales bacterium]|nr:leucyl aminopeptidase family protein [Sneathiellales bacterium]